MGGMENIMTMMKQFEGMEKEGGIGDISNVLGGGKKKKR